MNTNIRIVSMIVLSATALFSLELNGDIKGGLNIGTMFGTTVDDLVENGFDKTPTPAITGGVGVELAFSEKVSRASRYNEGYGVH